MDWPTLTIQERHSIEDNAYLPHAGRDSGRFGTLSVNGQAALRKFARYARETALGVLHISGLILAKWEDPSKMVALGKCTATMNRFHPSTEWHHDGTLGRGRTEEG